MTIVSDYFALGGGLDYVTPAIQIKPGFARQAENYEADLRGYRRCDGFERFDGQPKPSAASFYILDFDAADAEITEGDIVTGGNSGATGEALIDAVLESGSYVGTDGAGYLVLVNVSDTFEDDEGLEVSAVQKAVANGTTVTNQADTDALYNTYLQDAIETRRADIATVPGSGNMRGVQTYNGDTYAFRDNAGGTAVDMYKSTTAGWVLQDLGETLTFTSGGTTEIAEDDTVTGSVSGETAVVKRVIVTSGSWAGGDAAGRLIVYSVSGTFQAENLLVSAVNLATIAADAVPNTLQPAGKFDFVNFNFGGHTGTYRMYGCDGVSTAFEWDGAVFVPIITGMTTDTPTHIWAHRYHLFLSFVGGSVQHSSPGDPYEWNPITGASELGLGEEITGFRDNDSETLLILGRNTVAILYGADVDTWSLEVKTRESGAVEWTVQHVGKVTFMDDVGLRSWETSQNFGDFQLGTYTRLIAPLFREKREAGVTPTASIRVRSKDQYRIFFSDGTGVSIYFGKPNPECMVFNLGKVVHCACSGEDSSGNELLFFGSTDGYIYELDAGTSFDGAAVTAYIRLPFNHVGSPDFHKHWRRLTLEMDGPVEMVVDLAVDFGYGDPEQPVPASQAFTVAGGGGYWNIDNWNEFYWSAPAIGQAEAHIDGEGTNISVSFLSEKIYETPHILQGVRLAWSNLRRQR